MTTTFFTACNRRYWPFVAPYAASVLHHNDDAVVEICVENVDRFEAEHAASMEVVRSAFSDRFLVREGAFAGRLPHSVRFLETPTRQTEHTYIGDVDILVLDTNVTHVHLSHMANTGLPYSNVIRPGSDRLSGLHFTQTAAHYPIAVPEGIDLRRTNDEALLCRMIQAKGLPMPNREDGFRPVHGIHLSIRRPPTNAPGSIPSWGLNQRASEQFIAFIETPLWGELNPTLHPAFHALLLILQAALQARQSDRSIYSPGDAERLWNHLTQ